jgi:heat shock protein HtpX
LKFITRSLLILILLYGLVFAVGDAYLVRAHVPMWTALIFAVAFIAIQYLAAPWFIEFVLAIYWIEPIDSKFMLPEFPAANREFIKRLCAERGIKEPRIGVIDSGTPNAFSFGHVPADARVVVTTGLVNMLSPEELNAVLAHEIGHIEHWDFVIVTIAALVPLLLYQMYVAMRYNSNTRAVAFGAYLCYLVSQFVVLLLNRTREYYADHYSAKVTHAPGALSSALVKIACGLVRAQGEYRQALESKNRVARKAAWRRQRLDGTLAVMGISNAHSGAALALGGADPVSAVQVMQWDLVNPWARVFELNSTHPLTALRVRALNREEIAQHTVPRYVLMDGQRLSWRFFPLELFLWAAPVVTAITLVAWTSVYGWMTKHGVFLPPNVVPGLLIFTGLTWTLRVLYRYHGVFEPTRIVSLLEDVEVSEMRPRAVRLEGEIVGRGVPGAFWSPDLVLRDDSGMLFVLYRQSIPFARLFFAISSADEYVGQRVVINGWFRRGLRPYVEMSSLTTQNGMTHRTISRWLQLAVAAACVLVGWMWLPK